MNYGQLKTQVADWMDRTDIDTQIPEFIKLTEVDIYRDLRCRENEFSVTYTTATPAGEHLLLPQNFREVKRITWNDEQPLEHISDLDMADRLANPIDTRLKTFVIIDRQLVLGAAPDNDPANWPDDSELTITYYGTESLDSLPIWQVPVNPVEDPVSEATESPLTQTDTNTTRLLQVAPDLYLHGAMSYAYEFLKEPDYADRWRQKFNGALSALKREHKRADFSGSTTKVQSAYGDRR
jgi:hypothetical protein